MNKGARRAFTGGRSPAIKRCSHLVLKHRHLVAQRGDAEPLAARGPVHVVNVLAAGAKHLDVQLLLVGNEVPVVLPVAAAALGHGDGPDHDSTSVSTCHQKQTVRAKPDAIDTRVALRQCDNVLDPPVVGRGAPEVHAVVVAGGGEEVGGAGEGEEGDAKEGRVLPAIAAVPGYLRGEYDDHLGREVVSGEAGRGEGEGEGEGEST